MKALSVEGGRKITFTLFYLFLRRLPPQKLFN
jgi:hypothetical protein